MSKVIEVDFHRLTQGEAENFAINVMGDPPEVHRDTKDLKVTVDGKEYDVSFGCDFDCEKCQMCSFWPGFNEPTIDDYITVDGKPLFEWLEENELRRIK